MDVCNIRVVICVLPTLWAGVFATLPCNHTYLSRHSNRNSTMQALVFKNSRGDILKWRKRNVHITPQIMKIIILSTQLILDYLQELSTRDWHGHQSIQKCINTHKHRISINNFIDQHFHLYIYITNIHYVLIRELFALPAIMCGIHISLYPSCQLA